MSSSNCSFLTYKQISQEAGQVVWYFHLFRNFPVSCDPHNQRLWHSQSSRNRCFSGTLLLFWWSRFFDVGNLISGSSAFSKTSLNMWNFIVHVLLKPGLENFEHYFTSVWDECNCAVVWAFFGIAFLWYIERSKSTILIIFFWIHQPCFDFKTFSYLKFF